MSVGCHETAQTQHQYLSRASIPRLRGCNRQCQSKLPASPSAGSIAGGCRSRPVLHVQRDGASAAAERGFPTHPDSSPGSPAHAQERSEELRSQGAVCHGAGSSIRAKMIPGAPAQPLRAPLSAPSAISLRPSPGCAGRSLLTSRSARGKSLPLYPLLAPSAQRSVRGGETMSTGHTMVRGWERLQRLRHRAVGCARPHLSSITSSSCLLSIASSPPSLHLACPGSSPRPTPPPQPPAAGRSHCSAAAGTGPASQPPPPLTVPRPGEDAERLRTSLAHPSSCRCGGSSPGLAALLRADAERGRPPRRLPAAEACAAGPGSAAGPARRRRSAPGAMATPRRGERSAGAGPAGPWQRQRPWRGPYRVPTPRGCRRNAGSARPQPPDQTWGDTEPAELRRLGTQPQETRSGREGQNPSDALTPPLRPKTALPEERDSGREGVRLAFQASLAFREQAPSSPG